MSLTVVQTATGSNTFTIPGGDFGPGTRAMINVSASLGAVTAHNAIVVGVAGRIIEPGANIFQSGLPGVIGSTPGGSLPARTYSVSVTFVSPTGIESQLSSPQTITIAAGSRLTVGHPNPSLSVLPGATGWNLYLDGGFVASMGVAQDFTEGVTVGGGPGPGSMVNLVDSLGNAYAPLLFVDGGLGGSQFGAEHMSWYVCEDALAGTPTITFCAVGLNGNAIFDADCDLCMIAVEILGFGQRAVLGGSGFEQQGNSISDLKISVHRVAATDFGVQTQCAASTIDLSNGVSDFLFALETGDDLAVSPVTPTTPTSAYSLITSVTSSGGLPLFLWFAGPIVVTPVIPQAWLIINEPATGSPPTGGGYTDRTPYLYLGEEHQNNYTIQIRQRGQATIHLRVRNGDTYAPTRGTQAFLYDQIGTDFILNFAGIIQNIEDQFISNEADRFLILNAVSFESILDTVLTTIPTQFFQMTCGEIVKELFNTFEIGAPISLGNIEDGVTIELFNTNFDTIASLLDQLATASQFIWGVNPVTLRLYFQPPFVTTAPFILSTPNLSQTGFGPGWGTVNWKEIGNDYRNRQAIRVTADAFAHSTNYYVGAGQLDFTLSFPCAQVIAAWVTSVSPNYSVGTFTGNPSPGDTFTIQYPIGIPQTTWHPITMYPIDAIIIDPNNFVQKVTVSTGTFKSGATQPVWNDVTDGFTIDGGLTWTCLGPQGLGTNTAFTYTYVSVLDNTQFGQILIGATEAETVQNTQYALMAVTGDGLTFGAGINYSLPTWENGIVNTTVIASNQIKCTSKIPGASQGKCLFSWTGTALTFSPTIASGGASPQGHGPGQIAVGQFGTNVTAPGLYYQPGSPNVKLATPLNVGSNLQVEYTRSGGDVIQVENTTLVNELATLSKGTGKYQAITDYSSSLIKVNAADALNLAQQILASFSVPPQRVTFTTYQPGLTAGQALTISIARPTGAVGKVNGLWVIEEVNAEIEPCVLEGLTSGIGHYKYTVSCIDIQQIASYLDFWQGKGGSGGASGGLGGGGPLVSNGGGSLSPSDEILPYPLGVQIKTASYSLLNGDANTLIIIEDNASPHIPVTLTLIAPPSFPAWQAEIKNNSSYPVTIDPNGLDIDGVSGTIILNEGASLEIRTDGINYFTAPGSGSGSTSPLTTKGDIYTHNATVDARLPVGANGQVLTANSAVANGIDWETPFTNPMTTKGDVIVGGTSGTPARLAVGSDGKVLTANSAATDGVDYEAPVALTTSGTSGPATVTPGNPYVLNVPQYQPAPSGSYNVAIELLGNPSGGSFTLALFVFTESVTFAANFSGSVGKVGTNPTGAQTWTLNKNGSSCGSIGISTGGVVTFTSSGGTSVTFASGDEISLVGSSSSDATLANVSITLQGTRASVTSTPIAVIPASWLGLIPASQIIGIYTFANQITFPANFSGAAGKCGTNPTSSATFTVAKNGSTVGTVVIGTGGTFTFATSGGVAVTFAAGDEITVTAPGSSDATLANVAMSFSGNANGFVTSVTASSPLASSGGATPNITAPGLAAVATSGSASDLSTGTLPAARLPNPSASTLGGVESIAAVSHQFLTSISTSGVPAQAQPTDADLSLSNITTNNVSNSKHGFAPILPNDATKYLDGTGTYSVPAGGGGGNAWPAGLFTAPPLGASLTWQNQGGATTSDQTSGLFMKTPANSGDQVRCLLKTYPVTPFTFTIAMSLDITLANYSLGGICISDGTKLITLNLGYAGSYGLAVLYWTNVTTVSSTPFGYVPTMGASPFIWLQVKDDGVNLTFATSNNGVDFTSQVLLVVGRTAFLNPTKIGVCIDSNNASHGVTALFLSWTGV